MNLDNRVRELLPESIEDDPDTGQKVSRIELGVVVSAEEAANLGSLEQRFVALLRDCLCIKPDDVVISRDLILDLLEALEPIAPNWPTYEAVKEALER